ncbi:MAG: hypothetical protein PHT19_02500 [Methylococcus sp.]|nr:hypothetical protein [Methylococcus sp.]
MRSYTLYKMYRGTAVALLAVAGASAAPAPESSPLPSPSLAPAIIERPALPLPLPRSFERKEENQPFQQTVRFVIGNGEKEGYAEIGVPAQRRLVIEHVSALVQGPAGQKYFGSLRTTVGRDNTGWHYLVFSQQYAGGGIDVHAASQPMRAYADSFGAPVRLSISRGLEDAGSVSVDATVSGYLVDRW